MRRFCGLLCLLLVLTGCAAQDPYRVDTVVRIPVDPTEPPTQAPTQMPEQTEEQTMPEETGQPEETAVPTTAPKTQTGKTTGSGKSTGSSGGKTTGSSSGKSTSSKETANTAKSTEAPQTEAPETKPPETQPPETQPPETIPPETLPPETAPPETRPPFDPSGYSAGSLEYNVLEQINACRAEAGESAMSMSGHLCGIAYVRAGEACSLWSHTRPDGRNYTSALSDYGYGYSTAAESIAYATGSAEAIVSKWMESDAHRSNLLSGSFDTVGIGVYSANGYTVIACLFVG